MVWGNFEWLSAFELLILAFVFVPFFLRTKITTLPEFLEKRYDSRSRTILAIFSITAALFMHIGVSFYAGAVVFEQIFGLDVMVSIIIIAAATRSEEHTSELQSLMRNTYAVFCLQQKNTHLN